MLTTGVRLMMMRMVMLMLMMMLVDVDDMKLLVWKTLWVMLLVQLAHGARSAWDLTPRIAATLAVRRDPR